MRRIIILLCLLVIAYSCKKVFNEDDLNVLTIEKAEDLDFALAGLYYRFGTVYNGSISTFFGNTDEVAVGIYSSSYGDPNNQCFKLANPMGLDDYNLLSVYKPLYQTIASANNILKKSEKLDLSDINIRHRVGEAYFVRAYAYFWLARLFGRVPLIDNVDVDYTVKRGTYLEIYNFIENDLITAINYLPNSNAEARAPFLTPHRGSAKALLAEVYLNWAGHPIKDAAKYNEAAKMAGDVIDSSGYFGFELLPDIADLWNGKKNVNSESVFSLYSSGTKKDFSSVGYSYTKYDKIISYGLYLRSFNLGDIVGINFYNAFPKDYRKDVTFRTYYYYPTDPPCIVDSINPANTYCPPPETLSYYIDSIDMCHDMTFRKYSSKFNVQLYNQYNFGEFSAGFISDVAPVIYLLRYSRSLLTYAEAKARSGQLDASAYEAVNKVRRRANKVDVYNKSEFDLTETLSAQKFADTIVWERAWECSNEPEGRWFDLVRLEMVNQLPKLKYTGQGIPYPISINRSTCFFPIPKSDRMLNPNLNND
jgi:hypothetical protein